MGATKEARHDVCRGFIGGDEAEFGDGRGKGLGGGGRDGGKGGGGEEGADFEVLGAEEGEGVEAGLPGGFLLG